MKSTSLTPHSGVTYHPVHQNLLNKDGTDAKHSILMHYLNFCEKKEEENDFLQNKRFILHIITNTPVYSIDYSLVPSSFHPPQKNKMEIDITGTL